MTKRSSISDDYYKRQEQFKTNLTLGSFGFILLIIIFGIWRYALFIKDIQNGTVLRALHLTAGADANCTTPSMEYDNLIIACSHPHEKGQQHPTIYKGSMSLNVFSDRSFYVEQLTPLEYELWLIRKEEQLDD